jgi:hypothetical protein
MIFVVFDENHPFNGNTPVKRPGVGLRNAGGGRAFGVVLGAVSALTSTRAVFEGTWLLQRDTYEHYQLSGASSAKAGLQVSPW